MGEHGGPLEVVEGSPNVSQGLRLTGRPMLRRLRRASPHVLTNTTMGGASQFPVRLPAAPSSFRSPAKAKGLDLLAGVAPCVADDDTVSRSAVSAPSATPIGQICLTLDTARRSMCRSTNSRSITARSRSQFERLRHQLARALIFESVVDW